MGVRIGKSRLGIKGTCALTVVLGAGLLASITTGAASAATLNVTGTWQAVYHCEEGACAGKSVPGTFVLTQAEGSNHVSGTLSVSEGGSGTVEGTLAGNQLTLTGKGEHNYEAEGVETISESGLTWEGTYKDSKTRGTLDAAREVPPAPAPAPAPGSPPPTPAAALLPSATQILCNLRSAFANFTCTALVGDADEKSALKVPTGTVKFIASKGAIELLPTCQLASTPGAGSVASCSVTYLPPFAGIPTGTAAPVTAMYSGDSVFEPSTGLPGAGAGVSPPKASSATSASGEASTTVSCPAGAASCPVTANLSVTEEGKAVAAKKVAAKKAKPKTVTIGGTEVTLSPGQKKKISVKLNAVGRKLLKTHKHLTALLQVSSGGIVIVNQKVQIKPSGKGGRGGKRG
jgi:hypothetical protein